MRGYFSYEWTSDLVDDGLPHTVRVLFKPIGASNDAALASAIEHCLDAVLAPDVIVVICAGSEVAQLYKAFKRPELQQAVRRASSKVCIALCSFDKVGTIQLYKQLCNSIRGLPRLLLTSTEKIRQAGLSQLFTGSRVLVNAPPGFTFVKPSQRRSTYFLRAEEALCEAENVQFLAYSLLQQVARRHNALRSKIDVIFVDSMSIATVAYALRDLYCLLYEVDLPRVESFHSHDGLLHLHSPLPGTSLCLISASSSMNLQREWKEKTKCHQAEVITLLTLSDAEDYSDALYALAGSLVLNSVKPQSAVYRDLPMVGERFLPEDLPPKRVMLRKLAHDVSETKVLAEIFREGFFRLRARPDPGAQPKTVYFDGFKLFRVCKFQEFIDKTLRQKVSISVQAIIYQDDNASLVFAQFCSMRLTAVAQRNAAIRLISQAEFETGDVPIDEQDSLLIVAAVVGKGTKLLSISRDLRNAHKGARTYLVGAQVAELCSEIASLSQNLKYSAEGAVIQVETFFSLAVGKGLAQSFESEYSIFRENTSNLSEAFLERLLKVPGTTGGLITNCFLPSGSALQDNLALRKDFAYWPPCYEESEHAGPAVFATVAAILQRAREDNKLLSADRLSTDAFQQVVLAPQNFARYNDGIIQACILRAAHPSELDYSTDASSSSYMLEFLMKVFRHSARRQGEAAPEFALALRSGRLRLQQHDFDALKSELRRSLDAENVMHVLIRHLLEIEVLQSGDQLPDGF